MPIVGSFAGASARAYGAGAGLALLGDFESIATFTLTGSQSSVEFTSIPQTYTHLQIRANALVDASDQRIQFNGDTGNNYYYHYFFGNGGSALTGSSNALVGYGYYGYSGNSSIPYSTVIDILDYANTNKKKVVRSLYGDDMNGSGYAFLSSTSWASTNAITSIKLFPSSNTFGQYSSFALYGVKA